MAQAHKGVTCKRYRLWVRFPLETMKYFVSIFSFEAKREAKWEAKCLNTKLPLLTLLYAGYSVKLKK